MAKKSTTESPIRHERRHGSALAGPAPGKAAMSEPKRAKERAKPDPKLPAQPDAALAIRRLRRQLAEALKKIEQLQACADTDFLLGVLNRRGFERELNRALAYIGRYPATGVLIVLDVDRLKPINDAFGHAAGDEVLKAVVDVLQRHVRASDVIGRLGGDEFALLLWNLTEADGLAKVSHLEAAIDALSFTFKGRTASAGASAGIAMLGPDVATGAALEQADRAMYARKRERRGARLNGVRGEPVENP
jgi:diguanylate cyclase (GGDEF)-like protein